MSAVFFLFLVQASLGLLAMLPCVPPQAGARFFKFCAGCAAVMTAMALGLCARRFGTRPVPPDADTLAFVRARGAGTALAPLEGPGADAYTALFGLTVALLILIALYNRAEHFAWTRRARHLLGATLALGIAGLWIAATPGPRAFLFATGLSSAWLLGAAAGAMILGHWYLVVLDLPIVALRRLTVMLVAGLALRAAVVAWGLAGPAQAALAPALAVARGQFDPDGVFVWMRLLFGLCGPLALITFIWKTVEIRSTQSATGILYVQLFLVMSGELLATYLRLTAGLPL